MFTDWDSETGTITPGSIKRASSSNDKVWGEKNSTEEKLGYGIFVAVNPDGGIKKIESANDRIHGIIVRDIYGEGAPHNRQVNIGHFSHGDAVGALAVDGAVFKRGDAVYIVASGADAGKVTNDASGVDLGYWAEEVSAGNNCVCITLGYAPAGAKAKSTEK